MSSSQTDENLSTKIKRFYTEQVRRPWKYSIDLVLTAIVVILAIVRFDFTTFIVVSFGCIASFVTLCVFLRAKRGSYRDRRQRPKPKHLGSSRVMKAIDGELPEGEEFVWESRLHHIAVVAWWVRTVLLSVVLITAILSFDHPFLWVFEIIVAASLLMCGYEILSWYRLRFCITNRRVMIVSGIISDEVSTIQIDSITDNNKNQTTLAKILACLRIIEDEYGNGRLETAGQSQYVDSIGPLPHFGEVHSLIEVYRSASKPKPENTSLLERILETQLANNDLLKEMRDLLRRLTGADSAIIDQRTTDVLHVSVDKIDLDIDPSANEEEDR